MSESESESNSCESESDHRPTASAELLRARAAWIRKLREWFWSEGFIEVETPVLSWDTVVDRHLDPIPVPLAGIMSGSDRDGVMYLQTSPEFGMKRLLSDALPAIFQIGKAFRGGERGPHHNIEFTMAEWYRVGDDYGAGVDRLRRLAAALFPQLQGSVTACRPIAYRDLFLEHAGVDPFQPDDAAFLNACAGLSEDSLLVEACRQPTRRDDGGIDRQLVLDLVFDRLVQPALVRLGAVIVLDYPAEQSALSQLADRDYGRVAERFELFVNGVELANGYHELLDRDELQQRNRVVNRQRLEDGKSVLPETSRLLRAMERLPACAGVALGVDRAVMVALGVDSIDRVCSFPFERA